MGAIHYTPCDDREYGPGQSDYEFDRERQRRLDMEAAAKPMSDLGAQQVTSLAIRLHFLEDTRLAARDALAAIVAAYDALTDYERMVIAERLRMAIERGRDK